MGVEFQGFDELKRKLQDIEDKAGELDGNHTVPVSELLTPEFLSECSSFASSDELFKNSGFKIESEEDFSAIPQTDWDWFIQQNTSYNSWHDMLQASVAEWAKNRLEF